MTIALISLALNMRLASSLGGDSEVCRRDASAPSYSDALTPYTETLPGSVVKIDMIPISGGTIKIGDKSVEVKPFWIAKTETSWEAFDVFTTSGAPSPAYDQTKFAPDAVARPSRSYILPDLGWGHHGYPVINVSIDSVTMYCRWLAAESKKKYRLPTEAEWEMACRAGADMKNDAATLDKTAWYSGNSKSTTHPIGTKAANAWGLFDMVGNVGEWAVDMSGKPVLCGGTFQEKAPNCVPGYRQYFAPDWQETDPQIPKSRWWLSDAPFCGFRMVCEP